MILPFLVLLHKPGDLNIDISCGIMRKADWNGVGRSSWDPTNTGRRYQLIHSRSFFLNFFKFHDANTGYTLNGYFSV